MSLLTSTRPDDKPFLLVSSFTHPHNPFTISQQCWDLYDDDGIDMPAVPFIPYDQRDPWSQRYYKLIRQDEHIVTDAHIRSARHAYYGMVSFVDSKVGTLLDTLEKIGVLDNTVVVFTADHGDMLGERGMWYKFNPYEQSMTSWCLATSSIKATRILRASSWRQAAARAPAGFDFPQDFVGYAGDVTRSFQRLSY